MKDFVCKNCSNPFSSKKACKSRTPVFCSRKCAAVFNTAQQSVKDKMSRAKLGVTPWNKGVKMWEGKEHPRGALGKSNPNTSGEKSRFLNNIRTVNDPECEVTFVKNPFFDEP